MWPLAYSLRRSGHDTHCIGYSSRKEGIVACSERVNDKLQKIVDNYGMIRAEETKLSQAKTFEGIAALHPLLLIFPTLLSRGEK